MAHAAASSSSSHAVQLPAAADDGMASRLTYALAAHGLSEDEFRATQAEPLPASLLGALRLHSMTPSELYSHRPPPSPAPVAPVSPNNEWHALRLARRLLSGFAPSLAAIDSALAELCAAPAEEDGRTHAHDAAARRCVSELGGRCANVRLASCALGGRGLVSARALARGDVAVSLPAASLLSAAAAWATPELSRVLPYVDEGEWTEHVIVILLLLHERRRGAASRWHSWLRLLPHSLSPLSTWSEAEAEPLVDTAAYWRAHAARAELAAIRAELLPKLRAASREGHAGGDGGGGEGGPFGDSEHTEEAWGWARAVIETRGLALPAALGESLPAGALVLAPVADMANHAEAAQLEICVDADEGALSLRTVCEVPANTQLCLSYGSLDAEELFEHHGIVQRRPNPGPDAKRRPPSIEQDRPCVPPLPGSAVAAAAPLRVPVSLSPCAELETSPSLLSTVLLLMESMGLQLDGFLREPGPEGWSDGAELLPARLLGAARMCSLTAQSEISDLPIAHADTSRLSEDNERRAIAMLRATLEGILAAMQAPPAEGGPGVQPGVQPGEPPPPSGARGVKRRHAAAAADAADADADAADDDDAERVRRERRALAAQFVCARRRVVEQALAPLPAP